MKFTVQFKDPDALSDEIGRAVKADVASIPGLSDEEREAVREKRTEAVRALCRRWFEAGEYVAVEIDAEAKTATVVESR